MDNFDFSILSRAVNQSNHKEMLSGFKQHLAAVGIINDQVRSSIQSNISRQLEEAFEKTSHLLDEKASDYSNAQQTFLEQVMFNFLTALATDQLRVLSNNIVEKYLRNSYKAQRMNRLGDSIDTKENNLSIRAGQMQLKEASFEDLLNESDKLS